MLCTGGCKNVFVPCNAEIDLVGQDAVRRMCREVRPEVVFHLWLPWGSRE